MFHITAVGLPIRAESEVFGYLLRFCPNCAAFAVGEVLCHLELHLEPKFST